MNKNKKRLSKLLIPMLALSGINAGAIGNPTQVRSNSVGKFRFKTDIYKKHDAKKRILLENKKLTEKQRQGVIQFAGDALTELTKKYELVGKLKGIDKLGIDGVTHTRGTAGHAGSVTVYQKKGTKEKYAVKYEPNPRKTYIYTANNDVNHSGDNERESQFYEDTKTLWKDKKWAVKMYDKYQDEYGSYTVTDFVKGKELYTFLLSLENKPADIIADKAANVMEQYNQIIEDLHKEGYTNTDLHGENLMVTDENVLKLVDNGYYYKQENVENEEYKLCERMGFVLNYLTERVFHNINGSKQRQDCADLMNSGVSETEMKERMLNGDDQAKNAYITLKLLEANAACGRNVGLLSSDYKFIPIKSGLNNFSSKNRKLAVKCLKDLAENLKKAKK